MYSAENALFISNKNDHWTVRMKKRIAINSIVALMVQTVAILYGFQEGSFEIQCHNSSI